MPKSSTLTAPLVVTKTFSGFRSRCTMLRSCARTSARTTGTISSTARLGRQLPAARDLPKVRALEVLEHHVGVPSCSSASWMITMFSCSQLAVARASRRKSRVSAGERVSSTLIATRRPRRTSRAR